MSISDLRSRSHSAMFALWVVLTILFLQLLWNMHGIGEMRHLQTEQIDIASKIQTLLMGTGILALVYLIVFIVTAVLFVRWMLGMRDFLVQMTGSDFLSRAYVGWAFFIPFVNLIRPVQVISFFNEELSRFTGRNTRKLIYMTRLWWGLWIFATVISSLTNQFFLRREGYGDIISELYINAFGNILFGLAAFFVIQVIQTQFKLAQALEANLHLDEIGQRETAE